MKILAVVDFGLTEMSGGYQRNMEVISRLKSIVNLDIVPSLRNMRLAINGHRRELLNLVKGLNSTPGKVLDILEEINSTEEYEKRLSKIREDYDVGIVYSNSAENIRLARKITKSPVGVQLQLEPFYEDLTRLFRIKFRGPTGRAIERFRNAIEESNRERHEWVSLIREGALTFAISVSKVPLSNSGLDKMIKYDVSYPSNAFDPSLLHLRRDKEDYAVYFTRLILKRDCSKYQ
ncbi:hypothetical protein [Metallosphaera hakonensis]|uniref:hypothetical protein n=1 Tax=Metallosphaera hakonensis TaxID=79601 RepID=UPI000A6D4064|nr:hypothetical protein [Metallosphaera hakonensis]